MIHPGNLSLLNCRSDGDLQGYSRSLATIFLPLTWQVWLLHAAMMVLGGVAIVVIEATDPALLSRGGAAPAEGSDDGEEEAQYHCTPNGLLKSIHAASVHFLWNGPKHEPRTASGKLALLALSFHTLIIAASYTASLAGFLASSATLPVKVYSFKEIQNSPLGSFTGKLCVLQSAQVPPRLPGVRVPPAFLGRDPPPPPSWAGSPPAFLGPDPPSPSWVRVPPAARFPEGSHSPRGTAAASETHGARAGREGPRTPVPWSPARP